MGYQETMIRTKYKDLNEIIKKIEKENLGYLVDSIGYYFVKNTVPKGNDIIFVIVCGDRHPVADMLHENFDAKPIENVVDLLEFLWKEYEYKEIYTFDNVFKTTKQHKGGVI